MANLIATPRKWKRKTVLMKLEGAYGADIALSGATDWIEARNVQLTPIKLDKVDRNIELPYMGNAGSVAVGYWAALSFDIAMVGSGTAGTAPKWSTPMLGCGTAQTITAGTSVVYNLISSAFPSVLGYVNIDGVLHKMLGMRGNAKGSMAAKGTPKMTFDFSALYLTPETDPIPTITRTGWPVEEGVNSANTGPASINGIDLSWSTLDWDFGQKISMIDLPGPQREIEISDRAPTASITVLAPDLDVFNPFEILESGLVVPISATQSTTPGKKFKTDLQAKIIDVGYDQIEGQVAYKLTLEPTPVAGNDEIALTCL